MTQRTFWSRWVKLEGITWYDKLHNKVLFDSSLWRELLQEDISLYRNILKHQIGGNLSDSFLNGNVAMTLNTYQFARELSNNANKSNWGIVTEPVSVNEPEISRTMTFQYLNGINSQSANSQDS